MNTTLILTAHNCFRPPAVLQHVREKLASGGSVVMATRDHPDTLPDSPELAALNADDWDSLLTSPGNLVVLDNLRFRDCQGRVFERWTEVGWEQQPVKLIERLLLKLTQTTDSLILVSDDDSISGAWRAWFEQQTFQIEKHVGHPARYWGMRDRNGERIRLDEDALQKRLDPDGARRFECEVVAPEQETLFALLAEYTTIRYDYRNPADPRWLNNNDDKLREMIITYAKHADPRDLLEAMETLYDLISEHVDFTKPRSGGNGEDQLLRS